SSSKLPSVLPLSMNRISRSFVLFATAASALSSAGIWEASLKTGTRMDIFISYLHLSSVPEVFVLERGHLHAKEGSQGDPQISGQGRGRSLRAVAVAEHFHLRPQAFALARLRFVEAGEA